MITKKYFVFLVVIGFLIAGCSAGSSGADFPAKDLSESEWQTFTSTKYQFTVRYPAAWQVIELPTSDYPAIEDQVWLVSETLPPPQTGALADIVFIFTRDDPASVWEAQYFDDYQVDTIQLGNLPAREVSGINKESRFPEVVVLVKIGDYYLQALPNGSEASLSYFDQVVSSIRFVKPESTISTNEPLVAISPDQPG